MNYKIFLLLGLTLLSMTFISAFDFDNKVTYSNNDLTVKLDNTFLGITTSEIGTATLTSHKTVDEILDIGIGSNKPAMYYDFNWKDLYTNGLGKVTFTDMVTGKQIDVPYHFAYLGDVSIPEYDLTCDTIQDKNGTYYSSCSKKIIGSHTEKEWIKLDTNDIRKGTTKIALIIDYMPKDKWYDAVWTVAGKEIGKHAQFSSWLANSLVSCWTLDETSGTNVVDYGLGQQNNGTNSGIATVGANSQTSSLGRAYQFTGSGFPISSNLASLNITGDLTLGVVFNTTGTNKGIVGGTINAGGYKFEMNTATYLFQTTQASGANVNSLTGVSINTGNDVLLVGTYDAGTNQKVYVDGTLSETTTVGIEASLKNSPAFSIGQLGSGGDYMIGYISEVWVLNYTANATDVSDIYNSGNIVSCRPSNTINVSLINPTQAQLFTSNTVTFATKANSSSDLTGLNVTIYTNASGWKALVTNASAYNNSWTNFTQTIANGVYLSSALVTDTAGNSSWSNNRTFQVTSTVPVITIFSPTNTSYLTSTIWFNATASTVTDAWIVNYNGTNVTLSAINTSLPVKDGSYQLLLYANNSGTGEFGLDSSVYFSVNSSNVSKIYWNTSSVETSNETFTTNVTSNGTIISNAWLFYNGTTYSADVLNTAGDNYNISKSIDIPTGYTGQNRTFYFTYTLGGANYTTTNNTQNISLLYFVACNSTYTDDFLNISFQDEISTASINASIPSSTFTYYLGSGLINKTLSYTNTSTNNLNYTFCATPIASHINVLPNVQYKQGTLYPQKIWQPTLQNYNNSVFNQVLTLLSSSDGIFVTFQVVNGADQPINGVDVNVTKTSDGTLINSGVTDSAGYVTFFLNPDIQQTVSFSKTGYDVFTTTIFPTQSAYTITLGGTSTTSTDLTKGISYTILPNTGTTISSYSLTNFNFTLSSTYWTLSSFGFNLTNSSNYLLGSNSSIASAGGTINSIINVSNYSKIIMNAFWVINGTQSSVIYYWNVYDASADSWSISNFFRDFSTYANQGMFGLDADSLSLLIFIIIFVSTGIMSYKFSISSPAVISGIVFVLVFFFDIALGLLQTPVNAVPHFPTILVGIVVISLVIKEITT